MHTARVDAGGRMKLSVEIEKWAKGEKLFITSLDEGKTGRIYPLSLWQKNKELLENDLDHPEMAEDILFMADQYGGEAEVDTQGRLTLPQVLRSAMNVENATVKMRESKGYINIYNAAVFEEKAGAARQGLTEKVAVYTRRGFK
jgi:MraZ protein